jgi:hypothetical protein
VDYVKILLLALDLIKRFTVWMERNQYIEQGAALQIKANLEASQDVLDKMLAARAAARAADADGVRRDTVDPNSRD